MQHHSAKCNAVAAAAKLQRTPPQTPLSSHVHVVDHIAADLR